ncbi:MAG TPA: alpha/beta fold hydrolase [Caldimonas sp.]|nr:alpha/beta fold hydrolase [Caldimonas sp.]
MIETRMIDLPGGIRLNCRSTGSKGAPVLLFLHGFPEAAFAWDAALEHFGKRFHCIAPNLRGYEGSSSPDEVEAYRARHLMADIAGLIETQGGRVEALVAHDWGGALAWGLAAQRPSAMRRLVIVNSPHPATFLRALQGNPAQQAASAYMNFLSRPDAPALLAENDYARMWPFFEKMGAADESRPGGGWLTESMRQRYREAWGHGLRGPCNYYRASPLRPATANDTKVMAIRFAPEDVTVKVPTLVVWGDADIALPASLLDGLDEFVPDMRISRIPGATHWIIHEHPALVMAEIEEALRR